jgi:DUF4097 and DUF4098 domain-containing protein YvlB
VQNRSIAFLISIPTLVILLAAPRSARADDWQKTYTVSGKASVVVTTNDGAVRVSSWDGKQIEARVETIGWKIDDSEVRIIERQTGDRLELEARVPRVNSNFGLNRRSLRIELRIPRDADLNVRTGDGSVETDNSTGTLDIHTGDGSIIVSRARGDIRLSTGDGQIEATGLDGQLDASSGDGSIQVEGRFDALNLRTSDGAIDAHAMNGSRITTNWSMRSGDGDITLRLPDNFQADLDATTGDGRINIEFPIVTSGRIGRSELRGKLNGGGLPLTARTGDGSIDIVR